MAIDTSHTLGDLVTEDPRRTRILERFGIDYCCNGHRSLADSVSEAGLDLTEVTTALDLPEDGTPAAEWKNLGHGDLAHDIVDTHHAYMWEEMPRLHFLVNKVRDVHGSRHPELAEVADLYAEIVAGLEPHMTREERLIFPAISRLEKAQGPVTFSFGSLAEPIQQLREEHDHVGDLFKKLNGLTNGYLVPDDACQAYTAMLVGLKEMEHDLHEHVHKENNILFPKVVAREEELSTSAEPVNA